MLKAMKKKDLIIEQLRDSLSDGAYGSSPLVEFMGIKQELD